MRASLVQRLHQSMFASCNCSNHMPSVSVFELVDVTWAHINLWRPCLLECFASLDGTDYWPGKSGCRINDLALKRQYWILSAIVPCTVFDNGFIEIPVPKNMYVDVGIVLIARSERKICPFLLSALCPLPKPTSWIFGDCKAVSMNNPVNIPVLY